jgi:hypothetical protein
MFQKICDDILNQKLAYIEQTNFPLNAKKIVVIECFSSSIKQFFFTEINYYCNQMIQLLTENANISVELLSNEDKEHLISILYDWVEFNEEQTHLILKNAIQTELFFLINPAKCLSMFLYKKNGNQISERKIEEIIKEFDFITDSQNIISSLTDELLELANTKETLTDIEFSSFVNDVVFNIIQGMEIPALLSPLKSMQEILCDESIPLALIDMFFYEYDLAGILTKIREYAISNKKESLNYYKILEIINETLENTDIENKAKNINVSTDLEVSTDLNEYIENIENEVDNTINELEMSNDKIKLDKEDDIANREEVFNNKYNPQTKQESILEQEPISNAIAKMRAEGLASKQIETAYLELENKFLINLKANILK